MIAGRKDIIVERNCVARHTIKFRRGVELAPMAVLGESTSEQVSQGTSEIEEERQGRK